MTITKRILASAVGALFTVSMLGACDKLEEDLNETTASGVELRTESSETEMTPAHGPKEHPKLPIFDACDRPDLPACLVVSESGESYPKTITINRDASCDDQKGGGSTTITISADMKQPGAVQTMEHSRSGDRGTMNSSTIITNTGTNGEGLYVFSIESSAAGDGERGSMNHTYKGTAVMIAGYETEACDDDVFKVNGTGNRSMETPKGERAMTETLTDVVIDRACAYPTSGMIEKSGERGEMLIDFGSGSCDNVAQLTKDGETEEINLDEKPKGHGPKRGSKRKGGGPGKN